MGDRLAHGSEHVKELMVGHLLWTNWCEVGFYLVVYFVLGLIYMLLHKRLLKISQNKGTEKRQGSYILLWEFLFYALLGIVATFGVRVAGVLLMFGFLVVPTVIGSLLGTSFKERLVIGWITGIIFSLLGSYLSYRLDFPTGAMIVVSLGIALLILASIKGIRIQVKANS